MVAQKDGKAHRILMRIIDCSLVNYTEFLPYCIFLSVSIVMVDFYFQ